MGPKVLESRLPPAAILQAGNLRAQAHDCLTRGHTTGRWQHKGGPGSPGQGLLLNASYFSELFLMLLQILLGFIHSFIREPTTELLSCEVLRPYDEQTVGSSPAQVLLADVADGGCFEGLALGSVWSFALSLNYFVPISSNFFGNCPPFFLGAFYGDKAWVLERRL